MTPLKYGSLCTGAAGLDMAVAEVFGASPAWHAEVDPAASRLLGHRFPGVPNLGDLTVVDWAAVEPVDILTAGYPCQPDSLAGKGLSEDDHRWIWPDIARAVGVLRPRVVVLENVPGHFVRGFRSVLGSLASLGYDAWWVLVRASDVGAPHRRERLFIVAEDADGAARVEFPGAAPGQAEAGRSWVDAGRRGGTPASDAEGVGYERAGSAWQWGTGSADSSRSASDAQGFAGSIGHRDDVSAWRWQDGRGQDTGRGAAADAQGHGRNEGRAESARLVGGPHAAVRSDAAADTDSDGLESVRRVNTSRRDADRRGSQDIAWGVYEPAIRRWEHTLGRAAPDPTEPNTRRDGQRLDPRFVEWMMGWPAGWVTDVPGITRNDQLKICGNGVVPQQAACALRTLLGASLDGAA